MFGEEFELVAAAQGGEFELGLGGFQRAQVAAAGEKQAFAFALPADLPQQRLFEQIEPGAVFGGKFDQGVGAAGLAALPAAFRRFAAEVDFIADFNAFEPGRQLGEDFTGSLVQPFVRVDENQGHIGLLHGLAAALDADLLHRVGGIAQAGGVDDVYGNAFKRNLLAHGVAGGASDVGNDGHVLAGQGVEQAGFAHIGRAHQHHVHAFAQNRALLGLGKHSGKTLLQGGEALVHLGFGQKIDVFFREIQGGFHQHAQGDEFVHQLVNLLGKRAFERAHGQAGGRLAGGVDKVGHAFGLRQIELAV